MRVYSAHLHNIAPEACSHLRDASGAYSPCMPRNFIKI